MSFSYLQDPIFYAGEEKALKRTMVMIKNVKEELKYLNKVRDMIIEGKDYHKISEELGDYPKEYGFNEGDDQK